MRQLWQVDRVRPVVPPSGAFLCTKAMGERHAPTAASSSSQFYAFSERTLVLSHLAQVPLSVVLTTHLCISALIGGMRTHCKFFRKG